VYLGADAVDRVGVALASKRLQVLDAIQELS
jgi:hypothetical protein